MIKTLGGRPALLPATDDDTHEITETKAGYLAEMLRRPVDHTQRFVEQISFVPTGGLQWQRNLQIQLPAGDAPGRRWWIVPLGPFARRRFPDFAAIDAGGERLNLLTREEHGQALAKVALLRSLVPLSDATKLETPEVETQFRELEARIGAYFVEPMKGHDKHQRIGRGRSAVQQLGKLLEDAKVPKAEREASVTALDAVLSEALDATHYLCWAWGEPGDVINVRVAHTVSDPQYSLKRWTIRSGARAAVAGLFAWKKHDRKEVADWFRRFGLAPINQAFNAPTDLYTASYYWSIAPPAKSDLTYLDWEQDNSYEERERGYSEVSSSLPSMHFYHSDHDAGGERKRRRTIRAYVRCKPLFHKQIVGAALLNLAFVWLLGEGRLPGRPGALLQGLLIAAPSVLIAFLTQQQRHYYEHMLRPARGILWCYLVVCGFFLIAVAFSGQALSEGGPGVGLVAEVAALALAASSVAILVWHMPLGHWYESLVGKRFKRNVRDRKMEPWKAYEAAYESLARRIWRLVVICSVLTIPALLPFWDPPESAPGKDRDAAHGPVLIERAEPSRSPLSGSGEGGIRTHEAG